MNIWEKAGFLKSGREHPQSLNGTIFAKSDGTIIEIPFKYDDIANQYDEIIGIIPIEHTLPTRTIYITQHWKPFVCGCRLRLQDGTIMTVKSVEPDVDSKAAFYNKRSVKGLTITLKGGDSDA